MRNFFVTGSLFFFSTVAVSGPVAVIDSGVDYQHSDLSHLIWNNDLEIEGNEIDDDANGYIDDMRGWNFANNHARLIEYDDEDYFRPSIVKFLDIQSRGLLGKATQGETEWAKNQLRSSEFITAINGYLTYAHGTHVAGIMMRGVEKAELIDIRVIPGKTVDEAKRRLINDVQEAIDAEQDINFIAEFIVKLGLRYIARTNAKMFGDVASYLDTQGTQVANASVGMGMQQARTLVEPIVTVLTGQQPAPEDIVNEFATFFLTEGMKAQKEAFQKAPGTLFVFASGNDGENNDLAPTIPASIGLDNTISVGASIGNQKVAPFSNFGASTVDVFAPGVAIKSLAPMGRELHMSGTSQAAPYVANIATRVFDMNPNLSPADVKSIIMATVDQKGFLRGLAYTEGVVNGERALKAAELSIATDIGSAINKSRELVADAPNKMPDVGMPTLIGKPFLPSFR